MSRTTHKSAASALFARADAQEQAGQLRSAFRLMLSAAHLGDSGAQVNVGNYYDDGKGVKRSREAALYWYKRAYRRGESAAAHNIGVLWRKENKFTRALYWFGRAVQMGDDEANLEIGKHYLLAEKNPRKAIPYLKRVKPTGWVTEAGTEEAAKLLKQAQLMLKTYAPTAR